jgi:hypothetical protein
MWACPDRGDFFRGNPLLAAEHKHEKHRALRYRKDHTMRQANLYVKELTFIGLARTKNKNTGQKEITLPLSLRLCRSE